MPLKLTTYYQGSEIPDFPGIQYVSFERAISDLRRNSGLHPASDYGFGRRKTCCATACCHPQKHPHVSSRFHQTLRNLWHGRISDSGSRQGKDIRRNAGAPHHGGFAELVSNRIRNLENAMFGYKYFRSNRYFPVNWLRGTKLASRHRKRRTAFQPLPYPPDQKRPEKRSKSRRGTYGRRDTRIFEYAEASLFVPHP